MSAATSSARACQDVARRAMARPMGASPTTHAPPAAPTVSPVSRARGLAAALGLGGLLAVSLILEARVWWRAPAQAHYAAAAAAVRQAFTPADGWVAAPAFALRPLEALGDLRAVGIGAAKAGLALGVGTLFVVADPAADQDLRVLDATYRRVGEQAFGPLTVVRYRVADQPGWHAASDLPRATVRLFKAAGPPEGVVCAGRHPKLTGFLCDREPDWLRTTVEWLDLAGVASGGERAIWAHPPAPGDRRSITFPQVTLGGRMVLGGAHTEYGARAGRAPVQVRVLVDGQPLLEEAFPVHHGWTTRRATLPPALAGVHDVTVEVQAAHNHGNHFAFDLGVMP